MPNFSYAKKLQKTHDQKMALVGEVPGAFSKDDVSSTVQSLAQDVFPKCAESIRGSTGFWKKPRKRLKSMLGILGTPHVFLTLTPDDVNCLELFQEIDPERFSDKSNFEVLSRAERFAFLDKHAAFVTRWIYHRFRATLKYILSTDNPLGLKVTDWFWRVEEQGRWTLHFHCVFWLERIPGSPGVLHTL
jgi:hypothetical protein